MEKTINETVAKLTKSEQSFLKRILKNRKMFLIFSYAGIGIAGILLMLYTIFLGNMNGNRFALIILILLQSWANLKLFKVANILQKIISK